MQFGTRLGDRTMDKRAARRLPEYPNTPELLRIETAHGPSELRIFRPAQPLGELPPVYVNFHGGGFVLDLVTMDDPGCRVLAAESGAVVINASYVLAPQRPFPEPPHHVAAIVRWVATYGAQHGWDGSRLAVGGQSAGGSLAAAVARLALEEGSPPIALQVLHYPPFDLTVPARDKHSPLAKPALRPWMGDVFDAAYLPDPALRTDRLISPAGGGDTADLTGIAPAVVITAENDILREEGTRYAERLRAADALIEHHDVLGADHGYDAADDLRAVETYRRIAAHVRRVFAAEPTGRADPPTPRESAAELARETIAVRLRERIYVTFVTLAVALTLNLHADELAAGQAALTLIVSALGTVTAAFAADLMSHIVVQGSFPDRAESRSMRAASLGACGVLVLPLLAIGLAGLGVWTMQTAMVLTIALLVGTLGLAAWLGVRRADALAPWQKLLALGGMILLGVLVVGLKLLAH